ncbi:hypothetical protein G7Y79_00016g040200 [Physcia stellaris]|nr:hypothetical protein G7Y79_00016g040200 [Physcia stellaris]
MDAHAPLKSSTVEDEGVGLHTVTAIEIRNAQDVGSAALGIAVQAGGADGGDALALHGRGGEGGGRGEKEGDEGGEVHGESGVLCFACGIEGEGTFSAMEEMISLVWEACVPSDDGYSGKDRGMSGAL